MHLYPLHVSVKLHVPPFTHGDTLHESGSTYKQNTVAAVTLIRFDLKFNFLYPVNQEENQDHPRTGP